MTQRREIRLPSTRAIEAFVSAAETLSFRTTAERLNVTVSAISHRITALEREVGVRLFDRSGKMITLTLAGKEYYASVFPVIQDLMKITDSLGGAGFGNALKISTFQLFNEGWLTERIGKFIDAHPEVDLEIRSLRRRDVMDADITFKIIREGEERAGYERLFDWNGLPICDRQFAERHRLRKPKDLAGVRLIETASARDAWPRWFAAAGLPDLSWQQSIVVDSPALQMDLIRRGVGIGIATDFLTGLASNSNLVAPFDIIYRYPGGIYVNRPADLEREIVTKFRTWLSEEIAAS